MSDDRRKVKADRRRISVQTHEEGAWAKRLGITIARLRAIKKVVGDSAAKIRAHLQRRKGSRRDPSWTAGPIEPVKVKVRKRAAKK